MNGVHSDVFTGELHRYPRFLVPVNTELLLARFAELQAIIARYNAAATDAVDLHDKPELPF